jgi:hypothetical protein
MLMARNANKTKNTVTNCRETATMLSDSDAAMRLLDVLERIAEAASAHGSNTQTKEKSA